MKVLTMFGSIPGTAGNPIVSSVVLLLSAFLLCSVVFIGTTCTNAFSPTTTTSTTIKSFRPTTRSMTYLHSTSTTTTNKNNENNENDPTPTPTSSSFRYALLFDCDGVILETEELHRQAYNAAFDEFQLKIDDRPVEWSIEYYDILQNSIGGGIPKMRHYFRTERNNRFPSFVSRKTQNDVVVDGPLPSTTSLISSPPPSTVEEEEQLIQDIQTRKTEIYKSYIEQKAVARPGILSLMDEALAAQDIAVGVCSASTKEAALKVLQVTLGRDRVSQLDVCILGDDVSEKKPSPMIYNVARERLGITNPKHCIVIEDSLVGLKAAKAAGMNCIITYTASTANQEFYPNGADATIPDLQSRNVTLHQLFDPIRRRHDSVHHPAAAIELLVGIKDPVPETTPNN
ncbi:HAD superfamily hydrolase [Nitzschia inconspicua]|uniref:HAD superfamily hydrolase n=1 Tax=Nitzschia inconspicua TaxID=303405 RepID=A0A9K3KAZ8_9STRA|nr:HAD superfamily hydrolase [Nitzschia inconspicua]